MATTQRDRGWRRGPWVPVVALIALLGSGARLVTQQSGPDRGVGSGWGSTEIMGHHGGDGMMGRRDGSDTEITAAQAQEIGDRWLADRGDGLTSEDPAEFPGYYTVHTVQDDGEITGMLSVHAGTGDVWYHSWHDDFVEMSEHS